MRHRLTRRAWPSIRRLVTFGAVGGIATIVYAVLAWGFSARFAVPPTTASVLAYALAGIFSYAAHKSLTFRSLRLHRVEAPRFVAASLLGLTLATVLPAMLTDGLHLDRGIAILAVCIAVPALNFLLLDRYVYAQRTPPPRID
jgi:putative flippase GtrA